MILADAAGELRNGWKALLFILGAAICNSAAFTFRSAMPLQQHSLWLPAPWFTAAALLVLTAFFLNVERQPLASVGLRLDRRWGRQFLAGILAGAGLIGLMALVVGLGGGLRLARNPAGQGLAMLAGAWLFLGVALGEELLFRGYLFQRLERGVGRWPALALVSLLFALSHWGNPGMTGPVRAWATLNITLAGVLLGLCYLRTRSLAAPIGLHLGWNWTQGALLGFGVSGLPSGGWWKPVFLGRSSWFNGGAFGLEASVVCTLVAAAACWVVAGAERT